MALAPDYFQKFGLHEAGHERDRNDPSGPGNYKRPRHGYSPLLKSLNGGFGRPSDGLSEKERELLKAAADKLAIAVDSKEPEVINKVLVEQEQLAARLGEEAKAILAEAARRAAPVLEKVTGTSTTTPTTPSRDPVPTPTATKPIDPKLVIGGLFVAWLVFK